MDLHQWADIGGIILVLMTGIGGIKAILTMASSVGKVSEKMDTLEEGHSEIKADVRELSSKVERCATKQDLAEVRSIAIDGVIGRRSGSKY